MIYQSVQFNHFKSDEGNALHPGPWFEKLSQVTTVLGLKEYLKQYRHQVRKDKKEG